MMTLRHLQTTASTYQKTPPMPVLFVGHGNPMNGIEDNEFSRSWALVGKNLPRPSAILCISAHWFIEGTYVHGAAHPRTIHDFYGFPPELYAAQYPCPGSPSTAKQVQEMIKKTNVGWDMSWGIDHGTWIVMKKIFPEATIPVFQLSIDYTKPSRFHYELGQELSSLRSQGVLIIGSGNLVHNLGMISFDPHVKAFDWATEFDTKARELLLAGDHRALTNYEKIGRSAELSIPSPDHYWPMLYTLGLQKKEDQLSFFTEGITQGSISMRSFMLS